ncbi:MAG: hypothetical protein V4714_17815 [Bacteroidota bacterium]
MCNCIEEEQENVHVFPEMKDSDDFMSLDLVGLGFDFIKEKKFTCSVAELRFIRSNKVIMSNVSIPHSFCPFCGVKY